MRCRGDGKRRASSGYGSRAACRRQWRPRRGDVGGRAANGRPLWVGGFWAALTGPPPSLPPAPPPRPGPASVGCVMFDTWACAFVQCSHARSPHGQGPLGAARLHRGRSRLGPGRCGRAELWAGASGAVVSPRASVAGGWAFKYRLIPRPGGPAPSRPSRAPLPRPPHHLVPVPCAPSETGSRVPSTTNPKAPRPKPSPGLRLSARKGVRGVRGAEPAVAVGAGGAEVEAPPGYCSASGPLQHRPASGRAPHSRGASAGSAAGGAASRAAPCRSGAQASTPEQGSGA